MTSAPTNAQLAELLQRLADSVGVMTQEITRMARNQPTPQVSVAAPSIQGAIVGAGVEKPAKFRGDASNVQKNAEEARRFLASFRAYASLVPALNQTDATGNYIRKDARWIGSFLSFMDSEAGDWATPYREMMGDQKVPFNGKWSECEDEFKKRFSVIAVEDAACAELKKVRQGKGTVVQYKAQFEQYADKSKYDPIALRKLFYDGLSEDMKKCLTNNTDSMKTLEELKKVVVSLSEKQLEYDRAKQGLRNWFESHDHHDHSSGNSSGDVPMDINALRQGSTW